MSQLGCRAGRAARYGADKPLDVGMKDRRLVMKGSIRRAEREDPFRGRTSYVAVKLSLSCLPMGTHRKKVSLFTGRLLSLSQEAFARP